MSAPALHRLLAAALLLPSLSCADPDTFVPQPAFGGPAGVIAGSVTYAGPPPCTEDGHVVGAAAISAFDVDALPPPDGLGTTPLGLSVVTGDVIFAGIRDALPFAPDGARICPDGPDVTATASFEVGPLIAGAYQLRGFYDRDGDFEPTFSLFNLPTQGDVGGGAIDNAAEVLAGAPPRFSEIALGVELDDGRWLMPPSGALVEGIGVTLGEVLALDRPRFHLKVVLDEAFGNGDPAHVVLPADYQLALFDPSDPAATEASFLRLVLGAGVAAAEQATAAGAPFFFPEAPSLTYARFDANGDGVVDAGDSIPESPLIPALQPVALFTKLAEDDALTAQRPTVVLQGVTLLDGLLGTATAPVDLMEAREEILVALRPAVLCIDPQRPDAPGVLVNTHPTDGAGNPLIADEAALEASLSAQFGRPIELRTGCLPQGRYATNLVYDTGQAWTVPNEAGICGPGEALGDGGQSCGSRPRLASQAVVVQIGEPTDPAYCEANPTPSACAPLPGP